MLCSLKAVLDISHWTSKINLGILPSFAIFTGLNNRHNNRTSPIRRLAKLK